MRDSQGATGAYSGSRDNPGGPHPLPIPPEIPAWWLLPPILALAVTAIVVVVVLVRWS